MSKLKEFVENKKGYELKCKVAQEMADNASKVLQNLFIT